MLQRELTREQVVRAGEQILDNMEEHILERGYTIFSNGMVFNIYVENGSLVSSDVQGTRVYRIALDLNDFHNSTCSCPYLRPCKHIAATFFQIYSVFDNPRNFLLKVHQPRTSTFTLSKLIPVYKKVGTDSLRRDAGFTSASALSENGTVSDWRSFLESWTRNLSSAMETHRSSAELLSSYHSVLAFAADWPEELTKLFSIHANLVHMGALHRYMQKHYSAAWLPELSQTAERLLEHLEAALYDLDVNQVKKYYPDHLTDTLVAVQEWKKSEFPSIYGDMAYRMLWWYALDDPAWIQKEVKELERLTHDESFSAAARARYQTLQAHFWVMAGQDEQAFQVWERSKQLPLLYYLMYIKTFAIKSEWQRLLLWIDRLQRLIGAADQHEYRLVMSIWQHAMAQAGREDETGPLLKKFLPQSFPEYAAYLHDRRQYKQWLDLHMSYRVSLSDMDHLSVKAIENEEPSLLLPVYLREINRRIAERNREAYKEAVRLLKQARSCFTKANQQERWERFIDQLSSAHHRLRAFQEELRRGNLIS